MSTRILESLLSCAGKLRVGLAALALSLFSLHPVWADDTEIYFNATHSAGVKPNLLFILDASLSMNWFDCDDGSVLKGNTHCNDGTVNGETSRLDRMVVAMEQVLATLPNDLNVGIMRFGGYDGGRIIYPITDLAEPGVRDEIDSVIKDIVAVIGTPTVGALEETYRYFSGLPVKHGAVRAITNQDVSKRYSRVSHPDTYTGGQLAGRGTCSDDDLNSTDCQYEHVAGSPVYKSPIVSECQSNYAILLTDGAPWVGSTANVPPVYDETIETIKALNGGDCKGVGRHGLCGEEMSSYMHNNDIMIDSVMPGNQTITTHSIGFNIKSDWIKNVAIEGGGEYFEAESSADLIDAIDGIVGLVSESGTTIVAPSVTIDQFSRLSHREEIYLALFKPQKTANWVGNLKKYKFAGADSSLQGQGGTDAIDPDTGEFLPESKSFWSAAADGSDVLYGGAAAEQTTGNRKWQNRKIYSYLETGTDLTSAANRFKWNSAPAAAFGVASNQERGALVRWARGADEKDEDEDGDITDTRNHIGDPLHSNPVVVTYGLEGTQTLNEDNPYSIVFFGTNQGLLHAIDTRSGIERYAFLPKELYPNLKVLFDNETLSRGEVKPYGLDGGITLKTVDNNNNGMIEHDDADTAHLYFGMRRGGRNYYALDVSKKLEPHFKWSILGGPTGQADFAELGETWSKPLSAKIKVGSTEKEVLVFGGGYDPSQDNKETRSADSQGRAIYIVDADDGTLIWSGGHPQNQPAASTKHYSFASMDYSIPADLSIVNDPSTGYLSQIYAGDMGGRMWRFDIDNGSAIADLVEGGIIADFGDDTKAGARRFYAAPDLSLSKVDGELKINIAIGSGYRAHPLNRKIQDQFIVLQYPYNGLGGGNYGVGKDSGGYEAITLSHLFDTTNNLIAEGTESQMDQARDDLADAEGWYISMDPAEKILDRSSTFEGVVRFVSYVPSVPTGPCDPSLGNSYYYAVNLQDGTPFEDINEGVTDPHKKEFRKKGFPNPGISPPISTIFVENGNTVTPVDVSGVNKVHEWGDVELLKRWFWAENPE